MPKLKEIKAIFRPSEPFEFSDEDDNDSLLIDLQSVFGFLPEKIVLQKVPGKDNTIQVLAMVAENEEPKILTSKDKMNN